MAVVVRHSRHKQAQKRAADCLYRATDPSTPTLNGNETVRTTDYTVNEHGVEVLYVAPTIRMVDGKLKRYTKDEAVTEAIKRGDGMRVPKGLTGPEFSDLLSKRIGKARGRPAGQSAEKAR